MKVIYSMLCACILLFACQTKPDESANDSFQKNSQTVLEHLKAFQAENLDYSQYADNFVMRGTGFGDKDSLSLIDVKENDKRIWQNFEFKMLNEPVLLPGVDADTKKADGSVRHYSTWEVTRPATDSIESKSGTIKLYESFDFDEEGKIVFQQVYGDFTGLMMHLTSIDNTKTEDSADMDE